MQEKVKLNNLKIDWTRWVEEDEEDAKPDFGTAPSTHRCSAPTRPCGVSTGFGGKIRAEGSMGRNEGWSALTRTHRFDLRR